MLELGIEQEQKKIPYGISNFMDLKKSNFYYVDERNSYLIFNSTSPWLTLTPVILKNLLKSMDKLLFKNFSANIKIS